MFLPQVLQGRSPSGEPLTHLGWSYGSAYAPMAHIYPHRSSRRRCEASINGRAQCHHSLVRLWLRIYTKASVLYAPRYGLFMGYIARFLPPTRVLTLLLPCHPLLLLPPIYFLFLRIFSIIFPFFLHFSFSTSSFFAFASFEYITIPFFRLYFCEEETVEENAFYSYIHWLFCLDRKFPCNVQDSSL